MEDIIVTNVDEFIAECKTMKSLPRDTIEVYWYLQKVITEACAAVPGIVTVTDILCREYVDGYPCNGMISVLRTDVPARITWRCGSCSGKGVLVNWKHIDDVQFDGTANPESTERPVILRLILSKYEFNALSSLKELDMDSQFLIRSAVMNGSGIIVYGSVHDMKMLCAGLQRGSGVIPEKLYSAITHKLQILIGGKTVEI